MAKPFRLLITAFDYRPRLGGVATCADHLAEALARRDDMDVLVLAPHHPDEKHHDQGRPFPVKRVTLPDEAFLAVTPFSWRIRRAAKEFKPNAILNTLWLPDALATAAANSLWGIATPYYILTHAVEVLESNRTLKKRIRQSLQGLKYRCFRGAKKIFAVSDYTKHLVHQNTQSPLEKIVTVFNGVDTKEFYPENASKNLIEKHQLQGKTVLLTISRLVPNKGVDQVLAALAKLSPLSHYMKYLICGTGPDENRLRQLSSNYKLDRVVEFVGAVHPQDLRDYYNVCDVFLLVSREDLNLPATEGFGIVFLEAAACGKPSIGGDSGGIPDAIKNGVTGWLVPPSNPDQLANTLKSVLLDPVERKKRGDAALLRVRSEFTWDHIAEKFARQFIEDQL